MQLPETPTSADLPIGIMDTGAVIGQGGAVDDEWADWDRATFAPLAATDPELEQHLRVRAVD